MKENVQNLSDIGSKVHSILEDDSQVPEGFVRKEWCYS